MNWRVPALSLSLAALGSTPARADIVSESTRYVELCTVEKAEADPTRLLPDHPRPPCQRCTTYFDAPADDCERRVGPGHVLRCKTRGITTWHEVWCTDPTYKGDLTRAQAVAPPQPAPTPIPVPSASGSSGCAGGCALAYGENGPAGWVWLLGLALVRARRRR